MSEVEATPEPTVTFAAYLAALSEMAMCTDKRGNILHANDSCELFLATAGKPGQHNGNFLELVGSGELAGRAAGMSELRDAFATVSSGRAASDWALCERHTANGWQWMEVKFARLQTAGDALILIRFQRGQLPEHPISGNEVIRESLYNYLLDDLPLMINITDRDMRFLWMNKTAREQSGFKLSDVIGKTTAEIQGLPKVDKIDALRRECMETGQRKSKIIDLVHRGGQMTLDVSFIPILDEEKKVQYIIGAHRDITRQVQSQNARSAAHDLLNDVLERMPVGFIAADQHFHVLRANSTACALFGYTKEDMIGMDLEALIPADYGKKTGSASGDGENQSTRDLQRELTGEVFGLHHDGSAFPAMASVLEMSLGDFPLFCVMLVDLTEIRDAEQRLVDTELSIQQMQKQEALGQLAGNIAHDFNNLMAIVLGYADMIQSSENISESVNEMMSEIKKAVQRGAALTGQILAYAKHQTLEVKATDLHALLIDNRAMIQSALTANVKCELHLDAETHFVDIDENQFMQVLINLAVNARDAMPAGGELTITTKTIRLEAEFFTARSIQPQPGEYIDIKVADNGTGMPSETLQRVFDPYFSTKPRNKGTGLGLSVVYGIIKQHRGFIFCESEPGAGTVFEIILPISEQKSAATAAEQNEGQASNAQLSYPDKHVLVVDDEDALRKLVVSQLSSLGLQVHSAANGREALDFIDAFPGKLDIILTDIMMPEMTGLEMAEEAQLMQPDATLIFMSGYSKELLMTKKPRENFRLLTKPFKKETLFAEIHKVLAERRGGGKR